MRSNLYQNLIRKLFLFVLMISVLAGLFPVTAQTKRKPMAKKPPVTSKTNQPTCNGGWSGVVTYTRTLTDSFQSDEPTSTVNKKNRIKHDNSRKYEYSVRVIINGSSPQKPITQTLGFFSDVDKMWSEDRSWGRCSAWKEDHWFIVETKNEKDTEAVIEGPAEHFSLNINYQNGDYSFSVGFPERKGTLKSTNQVNNSGFCNPKNNEPLNVTRNFEVTVPKQTAYILEEKFDPKNPDVLSGTKTIDTSFNKDGKSFIDKISWKFRRCSPPLVITDVRFYQPMYPSPNSWNEIDSGKYTIDGNQVKVIATIANLSGEPKTAKVVFKELQENAVLPNGQLPVTVQPGKEQEVEYLWDTSGYSWLESSTLNQAAENRQVQVQIPDDTATEDIKISPRPVVIVPGLFSKPDKTERFMKFFEGSLNKWTTVTSLVLDKEWANASVGYIDKTVRALQQKENAWHVDIVAHSTGGLMARAYIHDLMPVQFDSRPTVTNLITVGTPHHGSPCAHGVDTIFTRILYPNSEAFKELKSKSMEAFNQTYTDRKGTKFRALVGNAYTPTCGYDSPGDGVVPNLSAVGTIKTYKFSPVRAPHEDMLGEAENFGVIYKWLAISPKGNHAPEN